MTEKYARMMESTAPEEYERFREILPKRSGKRIRMQEELISQEIWWAEDFSRRFPNLGGTGRKIYTSEDTPWDTSQETYLRGEISTYSDRTIALYAAMIRESGGTGRKSDGANSRIYGTFLWIRFSGTGRREDSGKQESMTRKAKVKKETG